MLIASGGSGNCAANRGLNLGEPNQGLGPGPCNGSGN